MDPYAIGIVNSDPAVEAFGEPVVWLVNELGVRPQFDELPVDADLARVLEWDTVPQDDDGNPYVVLGIARNKGEEILVTCKIVHRPGDLETMHGVGYMLTPERSAAVREWIYKFIPKHEIVQRHQRMIEGQFRHEGVDEDTVNRRRRAILRRDCLGALDLGE